MNPVTCTGCTSVDIGVNANLELVDKFLADRTIGRAYGTVCRLSVRRSIVCNVLYCGKTVRPSQKVSEGVNRKPGSKSSFFISFHLFHLFICSMKQLKMCSKEYNRAGQQG